MAAARPQFKLRPKAVTKREGGGERTLANFGSCPDTIEGRVVRSMEVVTFANGSFDVKLNVNMPLTKAQARALEAEFKTLVLPEFRKGIKSKGRVNFHFDSSNLAENPARKTNADLVLNPTLEFAIPAALLARSYDAMELGIYVESLGIPTKSSIE